MDDTDAAALRSYPHLTSLNDEQLRAATCPDDVVMILAGPGSGKTKTLTARVADLITRRGVEPEKVFCATFTNKAANEMKERIFRLVGEQRAGRVQMGTFHALCSLLLRKYGADIRLSNNFSIVDRTDSERIMTGVVKLLDPKSGNKPADYLTAISRAKAYNKSPEEVRLEIIQDNSKYNAWRLKALVDVYTKYQAELKKSNLLDFDDLLIHGLALLRANPEIAKRHMHYVLVDEFQDTNVIQLQITLLLCDAHKRLTIVGDPDQSIYAFRCSDSSNIMKVKQAFPDAVQNFLEQNYRSTQMILAAAELVIKQDKSRIERKLFTKNPKGVPPYFGVYPDPKAEAAFVAKQAKALNAHGIEWGDMAILIRIGSHSRNLEEALMKARVPFVILHGQRFYERQEIKDIIAYLRVADNPGDAAAFERSINNPPRKIGDKAIEKIVLGAANNSLTTYEVVFRLFNKQKVPGVERINAAGVAEFVGVIEKLKSMQGAGCEVHELINYLFESVFREHLEADDKKNKTTRVENVKELLVSAKEFSQEWEPRPEEEDGAGDNQLRHYLNDISTLTDPDDHVHSKFSQSDKSSNSQGNEEKRKSRVVVTTLHGAKGLEWPVVFMFSVDNKTLPFYRAGTPKEIDEERRLMYVGMTRAQVLLYMTYPQMREFYAHTDYCSPSPFLEPVLNATYPASKSRLLVSKPHQLTPTIRQLVDLLTGRAPPGTTVDLSGLNDIHEREDEEENSMLSNKKRRTAPQLEMTKSSTTFPSFTKASSLIATSAAKVVIPKRQSGKRKYPSKSSKA